MSDSAAATEDGAQQAPLQLAGCGALALALYLVGFTIPYPLASGLTRPLEHFARMTGPSVGPTIALVAAFAALFLAYVAAMRLCQRCEESRAALFIVLGCAGLFALALIPMYPVFSLDVFYYMSADRIWSVYRENPFVVPPLQAAHDPFFPYTAWGHYPLPYGPFWPWITQATSALGGGEVARTLLLFKALSAASYLASIAALAWAVNGIRPKRRLLALCIFAWNPLVLLELAGNGHNDAVCLIPALVALGFWARRASARAMLSVAVSFLIKAIIAVIVPALVIPSLRRAIRDRRIGRWLWTHVIPGAVLYAVAWSPFQSGAAMGFIREASQYYGSVTAVVASLLSIAAAPATVEKWIQAVQLALLAGFAAYYASQLGSLSEEGDAALHSMWRILILYFLVVSPFFSAWYVVWPTALAALIAERRRTLLTLLLCVGAESTYLVQFVLRPAVGTALGPAALNALLLACAAGPMLVGSALVRLRPSLLEEPGALGDRWHGRSRVRRLGARIG